MLSLEFAAWKPFWTLLMALFAIPAIYFSWKSSFRVILLVLRVSAIILLLFMSMQGVLLIHKIDKHPPKILVLADASPSILEEGILPKWEKILKDELSLFKSDVAIDVALFSADTIIDSFAGIKAVTLSKIDGATRIDGLLNSDKADAVILLSDGKIQDKLRWRFRQGLELFPNEALGIPQVYPLLTGSTGSFYDIALTEVRADDFAYVKNKFEIKVTIKSNIPNSVTLPLKIQSGSELLVVKDVQLKKGESISQVSLYITPDRAGLKVCAVNLPFMEYEKTRANNSASFAFKAVRDRIRVMHIAGRPSWDLRFLRSALKRDPGVDLVSFYIMRTASDIVNVANEELSLIEFPYNDLFSKDLNSFDAVIFQNFSSRQFFPDHYLNNIAQYVEKGGAFLMLGGDLAYTEGGFYRTAIDNILPFSLTPSPATNHSRKFSLRHTAPGLTHPITENLIELSKVPIEGYNGIGAMQKNSMVLLETDKAEPYLALREVGKGRTAAVAGDGLWGLNFTGVDAGFGNRAYLEMVRRLVRWMVKDPSVNDLEITDIPARIQFGETWGLKLKRSGGRRSGVELKLVDGNGSVHFRKNIPPFTGSTETIEMPLLKPGVYLVNAESQAHFIEILPSSEYITEESDFDFLRAIAKGSGGKTIETSNSVGWNSEIKLDNKRSAKPGETKVIQIWNHPVLLVLLGLLLGIEWFLRRRRGLL
jgi:uncharacterized membrane protein